MGYVEIWNPNACRASVEYDTTHCRHCEVLIDVQQHRRAGAWCSRCGGPVCPTAACAICTPFMKKLEVQLRRDAFARVAGLAER